MSLLVLSGCLRGDGGFDDDTTSTGEPAPVGTGSITGEPGSSTGEPGVATSTGSESASSSSGDGTTGTTGTTAAAPTCGDGVQDPGEVCDEGANNSDHGACKLDCTPQACGDGLLGPGELCDDGDLDDTDLCTSTCAPAACGDGFVQPGEVCDDGDLDGLDACTGLCVQNICGDGIVYTGVEACDDAGMSATCDADCTAPQCGDGDHNAAAGELCDDGNNSNLDACTSTCELPACGDGFLQPGEACDDGGLVKGDGCDASCEKETIKCQNLGTVVSVAPGNRAVLCQRPEICEKDYAILCPLGWHLCSAGEFNNRNDAWNYAPIKPALGAIRCREGGGAGQYGFKSNMALDHGDNCLYSSSRPQCVGNFGCDDKDNNALCCAPLASCGNGVVDHPEEQCDDGNKSDGDACLGNCMTRFAAGKQGCG